MFRGLFNQNLSTFAGDNDREDVDVSIIQPIISYLLSDQWSIGTSEMIFVCDWEERDWPSLPLGIKLAKLLKLGNVPTQFSGAYEYYFADDYVGSEWTVNFTAKFFFPVR